MKIDVCLEAPDGLGRTRWTFDYSCERLILKQYAQETRETKRHKFVGPKWDWMDERPYHSRLSRPASIPPVVLDMARDGILRELQPVVYIGWVNEESRIGKISLSPSASQAPSPDGRE